MADQLYDLHIRIPLTKVAAAIKLLPNIEGTLVNMTEAKMQKRRRRMNSAPVVETKPKGKFEVSGYDTILGIIKPLGKGGTINQDAIGDVFVKQGRSRKSASPLLHRLTTEKILKKLGDGQYEVLK